MNALPAKCWPWTGFDMSEYNRFMYGDYCIFRATMNYPDRPSQVMAGIGRCTGSGGIPGEASHKVKIVRTDPVLMDWLKAKGWLYKDHLYFFASNLEGPYLTEEDALKALAVESL